MSTALSDRKTPKPQITFRWENPDGWEALQRLAKDRGHASIHLFARALCTEALRNARDEPGQGTAPRALPEGSLPAELEKRLSALVFALEGVRSDVQNLSGPSEEQARALSTIRKAVRALRRVLKAELLQLRSDWAQEIRQVHGEVLALRKNLADTFALLLVKVDPKLKPEEARRWVLENFFSHKA